MSVFIKYSVFKAFPAIEWHSYRLMQALHALSYRDETFCRYSSSLYTVHAIQCNTCFVSALHRHPAKPSFINTVLRFATDTI